MNTLDGLRKRIPAVQCVPGCSMCCGPVPMSADEKLRIKLLNVKPVGIRYEKEQKD